MRASHFIVAGGLSLLTACQSMSSKEDLTTLAPLPTSPTSVNIVTADEDPSLIASGSVLDEQASLTKFESKSDPVIVPPTDLWERIGSQMQLPTPDVKLVNRYRKWYLNNPQYLARVSERAQPYMYFIVKEIERRHLPMELALLPIVESAFDPFAYSSGAASGLWQFTSPMARHFGLKMNWWYDGRRDVTASTIAALDMLEYLYKKTNGNWLYTIAAYNTGEGRVLNAVKNNKRQGRPTDFWSLKLPRETQQYVPQLLALAYVVKNAKKYPIKLTPIDNQPQIDVIDVGSQIDLSYAAALADMPIDKLQQLNPGYNRWATSPQAPFTLVIPTEKAADFSAKLEQTKIEDRLQWLRYQIKAGDSLSVIANRHKTTIKAIRSINKIKGNRIVTGKYLLLPVAAHDLKDYPLSLPQRQLRKQNQKRANNKISYRVKRGDSLWKIAKSYKVKINQLANWNSMAPKDPLRQGQNLVIWTNEPASTTASKGVIRTINYKVKSGDSLSAIAHKFHVRVNDVLNWNKLSPRRYLQPNQMLKLKVDVTDLGI